MARKLATRIGLGVGECSFGALIETHANWETFDGEIGLVRNHDFPRALRFQVHTKRRPRIVTWLDSYLKNFAALTTDAWIAPAPSVAEIFSSKVYRIPDVQAVYTKQEVDETTFLWTVVAKDDLLVREDVYDIEAEMYSEFPQTRFDFYVITVERLKNRDISDVMPAGFNKLPRETVHAARPGF